MVDRCFHVAINDGGETITCSQIMSSFNTTINNLLFRHISKLYTDLKRLRGIIDEMVCHDPEVIGSNPSSIKLGGE